MAQSMTWIEKHDPIQEHAAMHWEQGLPLGNGRIGAMVWGGGAHRPLTVSLDQAEIWDMRTWLPAGDKTWTEYKALLEQDRGDEVEGFAEFRFLDWKNLENKPATHAGLQALLMMALEDGTYWTRRAASTPGSCTPSPSTRCATATTPWASRSVRPGTPARTT